MSCCRWWEFRLDCSNASTRNIYLKVKKAGGMKITFQSPPKVLDEKMIFNVLRDYKILNCEVLVRDENGTIRLFTPCRRQD